MSSQRWRKITRLFQEALNHPEESRGAFLEEACQGDARLYQAVESLLEADKESGLFLEEPSIWDR